MANDVSLEQRVNRASDAAALKSNPVFREIITILDLEMDDKLAALDTRDAKACEDIVRSKQILLRMASVINRFIDDGKVARKELELIAQRNKPRLFIR